MTIRIEIRGHDTRVCGVYNHAIASDAITDLQNVISRFSPIQINTLDDIIKVFMTHGHLANLSIT
jgi:hypothetical protein